MSFPMFSPQDQAAGIADLWSNVESALECGRVTVVGGLWAEEPADADGVDDIVTREGRNWSKIAVGWKEGDI